MIQPTVKAVESAESALIVRTTTDGDIPIKGVSVCALAKNGTTINALTDQNGSASLQLLKSQAYTLLIAHPRHPSKLMEKISDGRNVDIRIPIGRNMGSLVIHSTGHIPGLNGRLNPILDTSNRTYLYADNIAINGGQAQPTTFVVNEPFELEDAQGSRFEVPCEADCRPHYITRLSSTNLIFKKLFSNALERWWRNIRRISVS